MNLPSDGGTRAGIALLVVGYSASVAALARIRPVLRQRRWRWFWVLVAGLSCLIAGWASPGPTGAGHGERGRADRPAGGLGLEGQGPPVTPGGAYGADLAAAHHESFGHIARGAAAETVLAVGRAPGGLVVDLGSGSGILARLLTDAGFDVLGVDISPDMVSLAEAEAPAATFVCAPLLDVDLPRCVAVTAVGEVLNYDFDPRHGLGALDEVFARVAAALRTRGCVRLRRGRPGTGRHDQTYQVFHATRATPACSPGATRARPGPLSSGGSPCSAGSSVIPTGAPTSPTCSICTRRTTWRVGSGRAGFNVRRVDRYGAAALPHGLHGFVATRPG